MYVNSTVALTFSVGKKKSLKFYFYEDETVTIYHCLTRHSILKLDLLEEVNIALSGSCSCVTDHPDRDYGYVYVCENCIFLF